MTQYKLFEIVEPPTQDDLDAVRAVIAAYDFPWRWTVKRNVRETGKPILPIGFEDKQGSLGYYTPGLNGTNVDPVAAQGVVKFGRTLAHELGHVIDDTVLTNDTRRQIHSWMHHDSPVPLGECPAGMYWRNNVHSNSPNEAFANLVPHIWCPLHAKPMQNYGPHYFTRLFEIRELVMGDAEQNYPFTDIEGTVHEESILWAVENGLVTGHRDGTFRPGEPVSRGQLATVLKNFKEQL